MITLSTYTQPPPVDTAAAVNEMLQTREAYEPYKHEDEDSFAEIFAGLLHKTGEEEQSTAEETPEVSLEDFSGVQIDAAALTGGEINFVKKLEAVIIADDGISESDLSEIEIPENYLNILLDIEDMQIIDQAIIGEDAGLPHDFFDIETDHLADFSQENVFLAQDSANAQASQETLSAEAKGKEIKKDGALLKTENIEVSLAGSRSEEAASLQKKPEKESFGKVDANSRNSRRDKIAFEVRDMRSSGADGQNNAMQVKAGAQITAERVQDAPVREITLELRLPEQVQSSAQTAWETKSASALENMLARELHQNFNGDIVRHASMALHDGGEGVIKLALKPDSLGNVKIHLKMSENKITGHIVVESEEALNAFKKEIASLEQAFRESGFTNAQLNLSLTADQRNADWQEQKAPSFLPRTAASRYDGSFEQDSLPIVDVFFGQRHGSVNMFA